jgi:hypothetical protein
MAPLYGSNKERETVTNHAQEAFLTGAPGKSYNPDNFAGLQCKDLVDAYCLALFGDWVHTIRPNNAAQAFDGANATYFTKIRNNPADPRQLPQRGDIINWGWSKAVPEGHIAVVLSATATTVTVVDMDGYAQRPAKVSTYGYTLPNGAVVVGWLRPKVKADAPARPPYCIVTPGDTMFLVAKQFGLTLQALVAANPQVKNINVLSIGQRLNLPAA